MLLQVTGLLYRNDSSSPHYKGENKLHLTGYISKGSFPARVSLWAGRALYYFPEGADNFFRFDVFYQRCC